MPKMRTIVTLDQDAVRAALDRLWAQVTPAPEREGLDLATAELHAMRGEKRAASGL